MYEDFHRSTEIYDLIYCITDFDDEYIERIIDYVYCPHCAPEAVGHSSGGFNLYDEVYTKDDIRSFDELFYGDVYSKVEKEINTVADTCTFDELLHLKEAFLENQSFYYDHPAFGKLLDFVALLYKKEAWYILPKAKPIFRTRPNTIGKIYENDEMWEPPLDHSRQNRYNVSGMPVLYCSNHFNVLPLEVKINEDEQWHNYATLKVNKNFRLFKIVPAFGYMLKDLLKKKHQKIKKTLSSKNNIL